MPTTAEEPRWVSQCCGAPETEHFNRDTGFCGQCRDHTSWEEGDDANNP